MTRCDDLLRAYSVGAAMRPNYLRGKMPALLVSKSVAPTFG